MNRRSLLTSIKIDTQDQTLEALKDLVDMAVNSYEISSQLQGIPEISFNDLATLQEPFNLVFDPFNPSEVTKASHLAADSLVRLGVSVQATNQLQKQLPTQTISPGCVFYPSTAVHVELDLSKTRLCDHRHITLTLS